MVSIPSSDAAFRTHIQTALEVLGDAGHAVTADRLRDEIAKAYPAAAVHAKQQLAGFTSEDRVLYAYRDGSASVRSAADTWWTDETLPTTVVGDDGRYIEANEAALELFGVDGERLGECRAGDFTRHEGAHVGIRLFETLRETGHLDSTAVVVRPDGTELPIAFHTIRDGAGVGKHVTVMRLLPRSER